MPWGEVLLSDAPYSERKSYFDKEKKLLKNTLIN